jgi:hypothetical protein
MDLLERHELGTQPWPIGPTLGEELDALGERDVVDMSTLTPEQTGLPFRVFISTSLGSHGPRVKGHLQRNGRDAPSFVMTIADEPEVVASSYSERETRQAAVQLSRWITMNREALLALWNEGVNWDSPEVRAFEDALLKV